jgi:hypothetical protein
VVAGQFARHREYVAALKQAGVECHMARFSEQKVQCRACGVRYKRHEEKETDVHFSLTLLENAVDNIFDRAIIISADSDHVPAVRRVRARYPGKQLFAATPPGRHSHARELLKACNSRTPITTGRIAKCLLPELSAMVWENLWLQGPLRTLRRQAPPNEKAPAAMSDRGELAINAAINRSEDGSARAS